MTKSLDPRLDATRSQALSTALRLLEEKGMMAVTHGAISGATGISRSTLYRHWPDLAVLRNATIARAATVPNAAARTNGPLKTDLIWILGTLMTALNETRWGNIAPQVIAAAATDPAARDLLGNWIKDRSKDVTTVFEAAIKRGEIADGPAIPQMVELAIAVPYFRRFVAGETLDHTWLDRHVAMICELATGSQGPEG